MANSTYIDHCQECQNSFIKALKNICNKEFIREFAYRFC